MSARFAGQHVVSFEDLNIDIFLEVPLSALAGFALLQGDALPLFGCILMLNCVIACSVAQTVKMSELTICVALSSGALLGKYLGYVKLMFPSSPGFLLAIPRRIN